MEELTVILAPNCHECDEVRAFIDQLSKQPKMVEYTIEEAMESPYFVFPTLTKGNAIVAYGTDIIEYVKKQQ